MLTGASNARKAELELAYYTAYHSGIFSQQYEKGRFPKYEKHAPNRIAKRKPSGVRRDWRELKALIETWNATAGGFDNRTKH